MRMPHRLPALFSFATAMFFCFSLAAASAQDIAAISGRVRDSSGTPVAGAMVTVVSASPIIPQRIALTDKWGSFRVPNLFPGAYSVKVTMPRFLPASREGIRLNPGGSAVLTVNLQNALDVIRRAASRDRVPAEDITWTLRSSRSAQPILRLVEEQAEKPDPATQAADYSGYFQLYSRSVEASSNTTEAVGSQFSVRMPLETGSHVTFTGQYTEDPLQPRGFGATYEFAPGGGHRAAIAVNVRQGALLADPMRSESLREVQVKYAEDFQWSDHMVFNYGAELGRADATASNNYIRPRFGISWVPRSRTTFSIVASSEAPATGNDPSRTREYFDRALYVPPALERYSHTEADVSHVFSETFDVGAAMFRDRSDTEALFVSAPGGRQGVLILNSKDSPSQGMRLHLNKRFQHFETGISYTAADGFQLSDAPNVADDGSRLHRNRVHILATRFKADVNLTQTEITAIYRWMSSFSVSRIDSYQRLIESNDPTLSFSIVQNLPTWRILPGKVQAILDARNVFEQSFGPERTQLVQYPRLVKGGINIKF
jgi:hypothetical protein